MWKDIDGYKYQYKISDMADIIKFDPTKNKWVEIETFRNWNRLYVTLAGLDGRRHSVCVANLMADAFMGGKKPGECVTYKNGSRMDCCLYNLQKMTRSDACKKSRYAKRRSVCKVDRYGNIVEVYSSLAEAAEKNFISYSALQNRLYGKVKDPYRLDGFNYVYEEKMGRRKNVKKRFFSKDAGAESG